PWTRYRDRKGERILDAGDSLLTGQVALGYAGIAHLLARVAIPGSGVLGMSDTVTVTATSRFNAAVGDVVRDRVDIPTQAAVLGLTEQVDRTTAIAGDLLTYRVNYDVTGGGAAFDTAFSNAVRTSVLVPLLRLDKQLTSAALARVGEPVTYRLRYGNGAGASVVNNVVLSDTLPAGLQYVSATPAASVAGSVL